eukprot:TRINITY_DN285_c3_g2_i1.p1 TRINITY_DN285_c3_g2~~TRINITY_DN285_c3_g2_i1.p1  ORF type:complete len:229 (+),score=88.64 TRINITY_DN285_c3_g2_i1:66-752(+)
MPLIIGLTGSIATGKSTVSQIFSQNKNVVIIDLDEISKQIVLPGQPAYNTIIKTWGNNILVNPKENSEIDRKKLGAIVFNNENERKKLNQITHPRVFMRMFKLLFLHYFIWRTSIIILDAPLLIETSLDKFCNKVVIVSINEELQLQRLMKRDNSTIEDAKSRMNAQMPLSKKISKANYIIDNSSTIEHTTKQVLKLIEKFLSISRLYSIFQLIIYFFILSIILYLIL